MKVYEWIDICLSAYGCKTAIGLPGSLIMPVWQNLKSVDLYLSSHEQEASYIAVGYGKSKNELVSVITTGGPGTTNCVSGIAAAYMDSTALVYISGRSAEKEKHLGMHQEEGNYSRTFDSTKLLEDITKKSVYVKSAEEAVSEIEDCCRVALSDRKGPTHISIPVDIQDETIDADASALFERARLFMQEMHREHELLNPKLLNPITRPLIIMGWGCWKDNVVDKIYVLAEKLNAPVLVTMKGSCCIVNNPYYLGMLGYRENPILIDFIKTYSPKVVFSFGSSMSKKDITDEFKEAIKASRVYVFTQKAESERHHYKDAKWVDTPFLEPIVEQLLNCSTVDTHEDIAGMICKCVNDQRDYYHGFIGDTDNMARSITIINSLLSSNHVISPDAGNNLLNTATLIDPAVNGCALFLDDGIRAMGSGLCQLTGMALADKSKQYIAIIGDGGMLMNGNIMGFIKRYNIPILIIVYDNACLGRVRVGQMLMNEITCTDLGEVDFCSYANSFGLLANYADEKESLVAAIETFKKDSTAAVVVCRTDRDEIPINLKARGTWN